MSAKRRADGPAVTRKPRRSGKKSRPRLRRVLKWALITALVGTLVVIGGFVYLYKTTPIPDPNKDFQTQTSFVYYSDGKTELGQYATQNRQIIPLKDMPANLQNAVIAAEDRTFYTNSGIDPKGIVRAAFNDARGGATQGASTITQQYVKILYLTQERSVSRKVHEAILSLKLQKQQSKDQILEGYLNTIYFGRGAYGVQAAAKAFFGVDADQLSLRQSAVLASVLNNPSQFDPANGKSNKQALLERYRYVLAGMASMKKVTPEQAAHAAKRLPTFPVFKESSQYGGQKGHMLTLVRQELHQLGFTDDQIDGGGLRVTTTFTRQAMAAAAAGVKQVRPGISDRQLHVAVATVQPGTGALVGFYGGQNYLRSQINWAEAGGMVGSTFKPVSLAAAITDGYSLKSTWDGNSPYTFPGGLEVHNEGAPARHQLRVGRVVDVGPRAVHQHRVRRHVQHHEERTRQDLVDGQQDGDPAGQGQPALPGHPELDPRPRARLADHAGQGADQCHQHGQHLRHHRQRRAARRRARHRQGHEQRRHGEVPVQAAHHAGHRPRHQRRRQLCDAAGGAPRHGHQRAGGPAPGGRQDRYGDQQPQPGLVVVVRRLHPAAVHGGDVRPG